MNMKSRLHYHSMKGIPRHIEFMQKQLTWLSSCRLFFYNRKCAPIENVFTFLNMQNQGHRGEKTSTLQALVMPKFIEGSLHWILMLAV